jgi:hypothetical protein
LLTAGGILSVVAGVYQLIISGALIMVGLFYGAYCGMWPVINALFLPFLPNAWRWYILDWGIEGLGIYSRTWFLIPGGFIGALGIVAVVGGISARRRKRYGLSLAGAICALPSHILGVLAVIFVALRKREFEVR